MLEYIFDKIAGLQFLRAPILKSICERLLICFSLELKIVTNLYQGKILVPGIIESQQIYFKWIIPLVIFWLFYDLCLSRKS